MAVMRPVLAVVDPAGASAAELDATRASLRGQVAAVHVLGEGSASLDGVAAVLVLPAGIVLARGALARLARHAAMPGRQVTRVFLPGLDRPVALWRLELVRRAGLSLEQLARGGTELERPLLDPADGRARAWVPADEIGVERAEKASRTWPWVAGLRLGAAARVAGVRSRLGQLKRARALEAQREKQRSSS